MKIRPIILAFLAVCLLPIGAIVADLIGYQYQQPYQAPATGRFHGFVHFTHYSADNSYHLSFKAKTSPRWYWKRPKNFSYDTLDVVVYQGESEERATVSLPDFTYQKEGTSASFTRNVLAEWLFDPVTEQVANKEDVDLVFGYFQAAADGSLPGPGHGNYGVDRPNPIIIKHWVLGYGFNSFSYLWLLIWLLIVVFGCKKFVRTAHIN